MGFVLNFVNIMDKKKKKTALKPADVGWGVVCVRAFVCLSVYVSFIKLLRTRSPQGGKKREVLQSQKDDKCTRAPC